MNPETRRLLDIGGKVLDGMGVRRSKSLTPTVPTTSSQQAGDFMNRAAVERLVDLTVGQSGWLAAAQTRLRRQRAGEIPKIEITDTVTEGVPENGGKTVATHPDTETATYNCGKFQATWYMTRESIREAAASGESDYAGKVRRAFAKAMGNDLAKAALRGDTDLDASTRLNRLLRKRDGWLKQIRASANRGQTTRGSAFARSLWPALKRKLPQQFREDPALRWFLAGDIDEEWLDTVGGWASTSGGSLAESANQDRRRLSPLGIPPLIIPQMRTDYGFDTVKGSAVVADNIVDNTTSIEVRVNTLLGGASSANAGRLVKVTRNSTGQSETLEVKWDSTHNYVDTAGLLGQSTVSTTASDYTLDLADLTSVFLTNPQNLFIVLCDEVRAYSKWEQESERWRVDVYYEADFGLFNNDAVAIWDGIIVPQADFGS